MLDGSNCSGRGWDKNTPLRYVSQVIHKLDDGTYPTEETKCFCGIEPARDSVIVERDRYTIPHRMVMCENCLLIRANPRMTKEAYAEFYKNEYRYIYDGFEFREKSEDDDFLFQQAAQKGVDLKAFLLQSHITPKVIVDIGSDKGGTIMPFKDDGAEVYGVEICDRGRSYAERMGIRCFATIAEVVKAGIKADLVIMQDIIEHFTDLHEMEQIKDILAPKGKLFIYTPGLLAISPNRAFQNAHTYQFIGATLEFVMERLGYGEVMLDDHIISLWRYTGPPMFAPEYPLEWRQQIVEHLMQSEIRTVAPIRSHCKFSETSMLTNLSTNLSQRVPVMTELCGKYSGSCVIVAGGPSVDGQLDKIHALVDTGKPLIVIERMYPWTFKHGLKPTFVVQLDASDGVEEGFSHIDPDAIHLIACTSHPKVFEALKGFKHYIFSGVGGAHPDGNSDWHKNGYEKNLVINTGGSVALAAMTIAEVLGFRSLHCFGFDFMVPNHEKTYAADIAGESVDRSYMEIEVGEEREKVLTCTSFLAFTQQFFNMVKTARQWGMLDTIEVHGESLINKMWDRSEGEWLSQGDKDTDAHAVLA